MAETQQKQVQNEDVQFAVLLYQLKDGNLGVQKVDGLPEGTMDQLWGLLALLQRNIEAEHQATVNLQFMSRLQSQVQAQQDGLERKESGLIVPT